MSDTDSKKLYKQYKLSYVVCSDVGVERKENQDYYAYSKTGKSQLFIVADGMGGATGGEVASSTACHIIARNAYSLEGKIVQALSRFTQVQCLWGLHVAGLVTATDALEYCIWRTVIK